MTFAILPTAILSDDNLTRLDTSIFAALKSHARPNKPLVWPSRTRLARLAHCSLSAVSRSLKRLVLAGWIAITRTGRANRVTVFDAPRAHQMCSESHIASLDEETNEKPPYPPLGDVVVDIEPVAEPEAVDQDQDDQDAITPDQAAFVIALFNQMTGARLDATARPLTRLVDRRLRTYTPAQLQVAIAFFASLWRGTPMEAHSRNLRTVLSPTRIEFALSETARKSTAGAGAATRIWKPDPPPQKAEPATVRASIAGMLKALRG
jgi:DNA-binding MarR family transcriptional regulator